ncbi:MAG TPA: hypothetical protein VGK67_36695 [Myxococcales bacterium]|jgi:hypothetical protein
MTRWLFAFLLTLAIELPLAATLLRRHEASRARLVGKLFFANLATHPLVWFAFPLLPLPWSGTTAISETFAWLAEAAFFVVVFADLKPARAALVSLAANATSFGLGLAFYLLAAKLT